MTANAITIDGTINGDLWAASTTITSNGVVNGSVMAAGQVINISGDVDHAVLAVGQTININGHINGDVMVAGTQVSIASTAKIGGDLLFGDEITHIDGLIEGAIKGYGREVTIGNGVHWNVDLEIDNLTILPAANIGGDLSYTSKEEADIQSGAQVAGKTTHNLPPAKEEPVKSSPFPSFFGVLWMVARFLMALIAGLIIILIAPKRLTSIAEAIRTRPGASAGWGALILFLTPIAAILVCITIIGLPAELITLGLWGIALYLAQIPVGLFIGRCIIGRFREVEGRGIMVGALALGSCHTQTLRASLRANPNPLPGFLH